MKSRDKKQAILFLVMGPMSLIVLIIRNCASILEKLMFCIIEVFQVFILEEWRLKEDWPTIHYEVNWFDKAL